MNGKFFSKKKMIFSVGIVVTVLFLLVFLSNVTAQIRKMDVKDREIKKIITLDVAKDLMIKSVYNNQLGKRALYANPVFKQKGVKISSWRNPNLITVKNDSWFFFVDEMPGANWEHKASYIMVDKVSGAVEKIETMSPPEETLEMKPLNEIATVHMAVLKDNVKAISISAAKFGGIIQFLKRPRYAVVLSGGMNNTYNYGRYWNDMSFIYKALKQKYGYSDSEIIVLFANGTHTPSADLDGDGTADIDYACTKANLTTVMNKVAGNIAADGKFFFYATNHGGDDAGDYNSNLILWGESIKDSEFAALTKNIKCGQANYVFEQCFSGGMMDDILKAQTYPCSNPKVCVMTAARHDEVSWGCDTEGSYDEYIYHWTSAIFGKTPTGAAVNADTNHDGIVSMKEAHEYAKSHDSQDEHPQIGSCIATASDTGL